MGELGELIAFLRATETLCFVLVQSAPHLNLLGASSLLNLLVGGLSVSCASFSFAVNESTCSSIFHVDSKFIQTCLITCTFTEVTLPSTYILYAAYMAFDTPRPPLCTLGVTDEPLPSIDESVRGRSTVITNFSPPIVEPTYLAVGVDV